MKKNLVLVFAKYPAPGAVKTRLVPPLTSQEAAALHTHSLMAVCEMVSGLSSVELVLVVSPDEQVEAFRVLLADCPAQVWPQGGGDLGARLSRATVRAFERGANRVILLGADSPTLPRALLSDAVSQLDDHDMVLGPSEDGGYYLLGLNKPVTTLFDEVTWGSNSVLEQTRIQAGQASVEWVELPVWYDLDRFEDLTRAAADLAALSDKTLASRPSLMSLRVLIGQIMKRVADHE